MTHTDESKETYDDLSRAIRGVPHKDKLIILGDFNARVGKNDSVWKGVLGKHGTGKENSNGHLLLTKCREFKLTITNTIFQQVKKHKTT